MFYNSIWVSKKAEFNADFKSLEKVVKNIHLKSALILRFSYHRCYFEKFFKVIVALLATFEADRARNGSKQLKNVFNECVLEFNCAPITVSVFFYFL